MAQAQQVDSNTEIPGGYRLVRQVGRGNFAKVWEAIAPSGEKVAVKLLASSHPQAVKRFQRETKVIRSLPPNPHVVQYVDHGTLADGTPFLVLEFVVGFTLGQLLSTGRRFSEQAACALMLQLCKSFAGLHALGVTHGDIKPNNIMMAKPMQSPGLGPASRVGKDVIHLAQVERSALRIKLLDFGLIRDAQGLLKLLEQHEMLPGKDFDEELDTGMLAGTPEYIAPEQLWDARRDPSQPARTDTPADVFGLGIVFYQLLTGAVPWPFEPDSQDPSVYRQAVKDYLDHRMSGHRPESPPGISAPLWTIIARTLEPDPKKRQGDANTLAKDIERYMEYGVGVPGNLDTQETVMAYLNEDPSTSALMEMAQGRTDTSDAAIEVAPSSDSPGVQPSPLAAIREADESRDRGASDKANRTVLGFALVAVGIGIALALAL